MAFEDIKKLLIIVSLFLVIFVVFFFLFWKPKSIEMEEYRKELSYKEAELIQLERDVKDWPSSITREMLKQYEDELEQLWGLIPFKEEIAMLLDEIQAHARYADLQIISLARVSTTRSNTGTAPVSRYVRVPYKMFLGGGYFGLIGFLRRLEDSKRLVTVTSIKMSAGPNNSPVVEIEFSIFYSRVGVKTG